MKKNIDMARAFRDEDYYLSLSDEERASLGAHPSGAVSLEDDVLKSITGGCGCETIAPCKTSAICTPCPPRHCL